MMMAPAPVGIAAPCLRLPLFLVLARLAEQIPIPIQSRVRVNAVDIFRTMVLYLVCFYTLFGLFNLGNAYQLLILKPLCFKHAFLAVWFLVHDLDLPLKGRASMEWANQPSFGFVQFFCID